MGRKRLNMTENEQKLAKRKYNREWARNNMDKVVAYKKKLRNKRRKWFIDFKKNLFCKKCKISDYRLMDFHHRDASTKVDEVSKMVFDGGSIDRILAEIEKCDVLCPNCHRLRHYIDNKWKKAAKKVIGKDRDLLQRLAE